MPLGHGDTGTATSDARSSWRGTSKANVEIAKDANAALKVAVAPEVANPAGGGPGWIRTTDGRVMSPGQFVLERERLANVIVGGVLQSGPHHTKGRRDH
jgi:plasmid stabilization system protein ParE